MAIPDPDSIWFELLDAAGAAEIALELPIEVADWDLAITKNDNYAWSYANRRTFWSFAEAGAAIERKMVTPAIATVVEGFWSLSEGRKDIVWHYDHEQVTTTIKIYTIGGALISTQAQVTIARAQGSVTFLNIATTAVDGYFTVEMTPAASNVTASIYGLKLIEQRIAQADL